MLVTEGWKCVCMLQGFQWSPAGGHFKAHVEPWWSCILRTDITLNKTECMLIKKCGTFMFPSAHDGGSKQTHWRSDGAHQTSAGEAGQAERAHQDPAESSKEPSVLRTVFFPIFNQTFCALCFLQSLTRNLFFIPDPAVTSESLTAEQQCRRLRAEQQQQRRQHWSGAARLTNR